MIDKSKDKSLNLKSNKDKNKYKGLNIDKVLGLNKKILITKEQKKHVKNLNTLDSILSVANKNTNLNIRNDLLSSNMQFHINNNTYNKNDKQSNEKGRVHNNSNINSNINLYKNNNNVKNNYKSFRFSSPRNSINEYKNISIKKEINTNKIFNSNKNKEKSCSIINSNSNEYLDNTSTTNQKKNNLFFLKRNIMNILLNKTNKKINKQIQITKNDSPNKFSKYNSNPLSISNFRRSAIITNNNQNCKKSSLKFNKILNTVSQTERVCSSYLYNTNTANINNHKVINNNLSNLSSFSNILNKHIKSKSNISNNNIKHVITNSINSIRNNQKIITNSYENNNLSFSNKDSLSQSKNNRHITLFNHIIKHINDDSNKSFIAKNYKRSKSNICKSKFKGKKVNENIKLNLCLSSLIMNTTNNNNKHSIIITNSNNTNGNILTNPILKHKKNKNKYLINKSISNANYRNKKMILSTLDNINYQDNKSKKVNISNISGINSSPSKSNGKNINKSNSKPNNKFNNTNNNNNNQVIKNSLSSVNFGSIDSMNNIMDSLFIKLKSNWGHPSLIGLSKINIFSKGKTKIKILKIIINKDKDDTHKNYFNNKKVIDSNEKINNIYYTKNQIIDIEVKFINLHPINEIIIYNFQGNNKLISAKEISIYYCNNMIYNDIIQIDGIIHLEKSSANSFKLITKDTNNNNSNCNNNLFLSHFNNTNYKVPIYNKYKSNLISLQNKGNKLNKNKKNISILSNANSTKSKNNITFTNVNTNYQSPREFLMVNLLDTKGNKMKSLSPKTECNVTNNKITNSNNRYSYQCNKIKIILINNYGDPNEIGLTGLILYNDNKIFQIENAKTIGALPKDLKSIYNIDNENRIFENIFNGINKVNNYNYMWLTCINKDKGEFPYIEITFKNYINLNKIKIYNYNERNGLNKCTKYINIIIYKDGRALINNLYYLFMGTGENNIDYSQDLVFPFNSFIDDLNCNYIYELYNPNNIDKHNSCDCNNIKYHFSYLPMGFIIKIELISNHGNDVYIGYKKIEIFDVYGNDVLGNYKCRKIYIPERVVWDYEGFNNNFIFSYINLKKNINIDEGNRIYYIFNKPVFISSINIYPIMLDVNDSDGMVNDITVIDENINANDVKILVDNNIVFEGSINLLDKNPLTISFCNNI